MSRIDENQKMVERLKRFKFTDPEIAMMVSVLVDISQSLAILADCALDNWQKDQIPKPEVDDGK